MVSGASWARERHERGAANSPAVKKAAKVPSRRGTRGPPKDLSERRAEKAAAAVASTAAKENIDSNQRAEGLCEVGIDGKGMKPVVPDDPWGGSEYGGGEESPKEFFRTVC